MKQYDLDLREYWRIIKKRRRIIVLTLILTALFSTVFSLLSRPVPVYKAVATVKLDQIIQVGPVGLYQEAVPWTNQDMLATQAAIIKSYPLIESAAKLIGLIPQHLSTEEVRNNKDSLEVVLKLKKMVDSEIEAPVGMINVIVKSEDARMAELGITDFEGFDFISPPGREGILSAIETLRLLDALDDRQELTETGRMMCLFPILPKHSRMIVEAVRAYPRVLAEVIIAATFLSVNSPFLLPAGEELEARRAHHTFADPLGDFVSYLKMYEAFTTSRARSHPTASWTPCSPPTRWDGDGRDIHDPVDHDALRDRRSCADGCDPRCRRPPKPVGTTGTHPAGAQEHQLQGG